MAAVTKINSPSIGNYIAALRSTRDTSDNHTALALDALQQVVQSLANAPAPVAPKAPPAINPALIGVNIQFVKLTTATTVITPNLAPVTGALLAIVIQQDATGNRQITWAAGVRFASVDIFGAANSFSVFLFLGANIGSGAQWCAITLPLTGVS